MIDIIALENPDQVLHLGDNDRDCFCIESTYPHIPLRLVRGNCDLFSSNPDIDRFTLCEKQFIMTHGHLHGVKSGLRKVIDAAQREQADVLLFGHTHIPHYSIEDGLTVVNPGSILYGNASYAVLEIKNGAVSCELKILQLV